MGKGGFSDGGALPGRALTDAPSPTERLFPAWARIPREVASFAAGLHTVDPELSWDDIAAVLYHLNMGKHRADDLVAAVDAWLLERGTNRSKLAGDYRRARRG